MSENIRLWIIFVILLIIIVKPLKNKVCGSAVCKESRKNRFLYADCRDKQLNQFPDDLQINVQIIDISLNFIDKLSIDNVGKYLSLVALIYHVDDFKSIVIEDGLFEKFIDLRKLDFSHIELTNVRLTFPKKIEALMFTYAELQSEEQLNISYLSQLRVLSLQGNPILNLPNFHPNAPLREINAKYVPLRRIDALILSRYCKLKVFSFEAPLMWGFYREGCFCSLFAFWLQIANIQGVNGFNESICQSTVAETCRNITNEDVKTNYEACMKSSSNETEDDDDYTISDDTSGFFSLFFSILPFLVGGTGITLITIFIIFYIHKRRTRRSKNSEEVWSENEQNSPSSDENEQLKEEEEKEEKETETETETEND